MILPAIIGLIIITLPFWLLGFVSICIIFWIRRDDKEIKVRTNLTLLGLMETSLMLEGELHYKYIIVSNGEYRMKTDDVWR